VFAGQFQQNPVPALGNIVNREWLAEYDPATLDRSRGQIVLSLDTASKDNPFNDWTVAISALVVGKSIYILDVFRARLQFPELLARTTELARLHGATVLLIEDASSGQQLIQSLRAQDPAGVPPPIARRPQGDKIARAMGASALIQAGRLFLPKTAHWLADFTSELLGFPASRHDDQVDALTQLLLWVQEKDIYRPETLTGPELVDIEDGATHYKSDPNIDPWL
jgi:predicted phage terminase large subunit-like protein